MAEEKKEAVPVTKKSKTMVILIIGVVLLLVSIALVMFVIFPKYQEMTGAAQEQAAETKEATDDKPAIGLIYKISNITVNPKGSLGRRFAVFEVALEYQEPELDKEITTLEPIIIDHFIQFLRTKTVMQLTQEEEMEKIRAEMKRIVNKILKKENAITNIFFTRYVLE